MDDLTPEILLQAYAIGIFPMAQSQEDSKLYWFDPDPRTIIPLDNFHISRRLERTLGQQKFQITFDTAFTEVMRKCAEAAPDREETWINEDIIRLYTQLHHYGYAHSIETWQDNKLVGGVYGISIGGLFAGESMFSRVTDASKVALATLLKHLKQQNYSLFDVQYTTEHLKRFGAIEISKEAYKQRLSQALENECSFLEAEDFA